MLVAIADTHAILWSIFDDPRLADGARYFLQETFKRGNQIGISSITLAETIYLIEKGRIPAGSFHRLLLDLDAPDSALLEIPFDRAIAESLRRVERSTVPDLPDRIISATALHLGIPVISRDRR